MLGMHTTISRKLGRVFVPLAAKERGSGREKTRGKGRGRERSVN